MSDLATTLEALRDPDPVEAVLVVVGYLFVNLILPATPLNLLCGYLGGFGTGFLLAAPSRVAAATLAFALSRTVLRDRFLRMIAERPRLRAVEGAVGTSGLKIVTLIRLSPILPSSVTSYILGATSLRARDFIVGTAIGTLPSTILHVSIGAGLASTRDALDREGMSMPEKVLLGAGLLATVTVVTFIARRARTELDRLTAEADIEPGK